MKRLLFPLISALTLSTAVHAGISVELHEKCLDTRDALKIGETVRV